MDDAYTSEIRLWAANFAPRNWAFCQGQIMDISQHQALFALIGTTYGGNGRTTFALPDLRGRIPRGTGTGPGLQPVLLGSQQGYENMTLTQLELPTHNHAVINNLSVDGNVQVSVNSEEGEEGDPNGNYLAGTNDTGYSDEAGSGQLAGVTSQYSFGGSISTQDTGSGRSFPLLNPSTGLNFIICLDGVFPQRN